MTTKFIPPKREATRVCPACRTKVRASVIDASALKSTAPNAEIDALRVERQARRHGDPIARADAAEAAERLRAKDSGDGDPTPGPDRCPVCGSARVEVNENALSPLGRRELIRSRQADTRHDVDRRRNEKSAGSVAAMEAANVERGKRRSAQRETVAGRWGKP